MPRIIKQRFEYEGRMVERAVVVEEDGLEPWGRHYQAHTVGRPVPRVDGVEKVTGAARFTADVQLPGMTHCRLLRSPHPHARLVGLDAAAARAVPGVLLVLEPGDLPRWLMAEPSCVGQQVAAVVAETPAAAAAGLAALAPEWEPLPFVVEAAAALASGAPQVDADHAGNVRRGQPAINERGDAAAALAESDVTVDLTFRTAAFVHHAMETHGCVAWWQGDRLTVWDSTQGVSDARRALAKVHGLPVDRVRVICEHVGGGFGAKDTPHAYHHVAVEASRRLGRPVRLFLTRREEGQVSGCRSATEMHLRLGADADGVLMGIAMKTVANVGAGGWTGTAGGPARGLYACPNVRTEEWQVLTHTTPANAFRAPGYAEGAFALEQAMDELAHRLELDPLELRLRNYRGEEKGTPLPGLQECYVAVADAAGWRHRDDHRAAHSSGARRRGIGIAAGHWGGGGAPPAHATVLVYPDGSVAVHSATQDIGTGARTALAMIAAEELGLPVSRIHVRLGDTEGAPYGTFSGGSMTLSSVGPAVRGAAADARQQLMALAADLLEAHAGDMAAEGDAFHVRGAPERRVTIGEIMGQIGDFTIVGRGARGPNPENYVIRTFCAQVAEVEVDVETGEVTVLNLWSANESGRIINPLAATGQVAGGAIQALGMALTEAQIVDAATGIPLTADLEGYRIPTAMDVPPVAAILLDAPDPRVNNTGAKGLGEPPIIPGAAAIANAIFHATGVRLTEIPITRARLLQALAEKGVSAGA